MPFIFSKVIPLFWGATDPGTVLGTAGYLSPEQAQGRASDARSDIFSFGALVVDLKGLAKRLDSSPRMTAIDAAPVRRDRRAIITRTLAIVLALALVAAAGVWWWLSRLAKPDSTPSPQTTTERITTLGSVIAAAISPDGKYVAYATSENTRQGLYLRQMASSSTIELLEPGPYGFWGVTFAPDGDSVYYALWSADEPRRALYRMPALGGSPRKLLTGIDSHPTFSPDAKRLAYVRGDYPELGSSALMVADIDGGNVRVLATRRAPEFFYPIFFTAPAWSRDGKTIVVPMEIRGPKTRGTLVAVGADDGAPAPFPQYEWSGVGQATWLPDNSGLVVIATDRSSENPLQLWRVGARQPDRRQLTSDLTDHRLVSVTADGASLVTVAADASASLWMAPIDPGAAAEPRRIGSGRYDGMSGVSAAPGGRLLFRTVEGGSTSIWSMNDDGTRRTQLTIEGSTSWPAATPDGKGMVFAREGSGLWYSAIDGQGARPIAGTLGAVVPQVSPDGAFVFYTSLATGAETLWKVPLAGGAPASGSSSRAGSSRVTRC